MNDELYNDANRRLDENNFSEAVSLFRKAALTSEPTAMQIVNLGIAEDEERLQFRKTICERYPQSIHCQLNLVLTLHNVGHSGLAVRLASEMISATKLTEMDLLQARIIRLRAALAAKVYEIVILDFSELWQAGLSNSVALRCRTGIVSDLASANAPEFCGVFDELSRLPFVEEDVAEFLRAKANELNAARKLKSQLNNRLH